MLVVKFITKLSGSFVIISVFSSVGFVGLDCSLIVFFVEDSIVGVLGIVSDSTVVSSWGSWFVFSTVGWFASSLRISKTLVAWRTLEEKIKPTIIKARENFLFIMLFFLTKISYII